MNELEWRSFVRGHSGRYNDICFPEKSVPAVLCSKIQERAVGENNSEGNQVLVYENNSTVLAYYGYQRTDGAATYYVHGLIFTGFPQSLFKEPEKLLSFNFITSLELKDIQKQNHLLEQYVIDGMIIDKKQREAEKSYRTEYCPRMDTLAEVVCKCLYQRESNGESVCIEVPEKVCYLQYCKAVLMFIFSIIPYRLRERISFATNPSKEQEKGFTIIFRKEGTASGFHLWEAWNREKDSRFNGLREMILDLQEKPEELLSIFQEEFEKPNKGEKLSYLDYIDYWRINVLRDMEEISPEAINDLNGILKRHKGEGRLSLFFNNKLKEMLQEKWKQEFFTDSCLKKAFSKLLTPGVYRNYMELLKKLAFYDDIFDKIGRKVFVSEWGTYQLNRIFLDNPNCSLDKLREELELHRHKLCEYYGKAVNGHEQSLNEQEMQRLKIADQSYWIEKVLDSIRETDHEYDEAVESCKRVLEFIDNDFESCKVIELLWGRVTVYIKRHEKEYTVQEIETGKMERENRIKKQVEFWDEYGTKIFNTFSLKREQQYEYMQILYLVRDNQEERLKDIHDGLLHIQDFDSYMNFIKKFGETESIMQAARIKFDSVQWTGGKEISDFNNMFICNFIGKQISESIWKYYYHMLDILIQEKKVKLQLKVSGSLDRLFKELNVWYLYCEHSSDISCVSELDQEEFVLSKSQLQDWDYQSWTCIEDIYWKNDMELELIWKHLVPMGYYPLKPWWGRQILKMENKRYGEEKKDIIKNLLFSWTVKGPGILPEVKKSILQNLKEWEWLPEDAKEQVENSLWLSEQQKVEFLDILRKGF